MKKTKSVVEKVSEKVLYSTGFICGKVVKLKDIANDGHWKKTFSDTKSLVIETVEKSRDLLQFVNKLKPEANKPVAATRRLRSSMEESKSLNDSRRAKRHPVGLVDDNFEKEIEEIGKKVSKV